MWMDFNFEYWLLTMLLRNSDPRFVSLCFRFIRHFLVVLKSNITGRVIERRLNVPADHTIVFQEWIDDARDVCQASEPNLIVSRPSSNRIVEESVVTGSSRPLTLAHMTG